MMRKAIGLLLLIYNAAVFMILMIMVCPPIIIVNALLPKRAGKRATFVFLHVWATLYSIFSGIWIRRIGGKHIDTTKAYIYTGNHSSYLDAVVVAQSIPQPVSPLGKIEMAKVPVFGWIYERVVILLDRTSKESRELSVIKLSAELNSGISILVFPEGTMNRTGEVLADFYDGAFRIAIDTQTDILPFVILNSKELLPAANILMIRPGILTVLYGKPIPVAGMTPDDLEKLKSTTRETMRKMILTRSVH